MLRVGLTATQSQDRFATRDAQAGAARERIDQTFGQAFSRRTQIGVGVACGERQYGDAGCCGDDRRGLASIGMAHLPCCKNNRGHQCNQQRSDHQLVFAGCGDTSRQHHRRDDTFGLRRHGDDNGGVRHQGIVVERSLHARGRHRKTIAQTMHGLDVAWIGDIVAQRPAQQGDDAVQRSRGDMVMAPHRVEQVLAT